MAKRIIAIQSKKSETVYLYEDESYWNKEKGYSTHKRTCIGKLGPDGKPIYNEYTKTRKMTREFIDSDSCYWVLASASAKTASDALAQYRERNGVELYFDDEKNLPDLKRLKNHNDQTVTGKDKDGAAAGNQL